MRNYFKNSDLYIKIGIWWYRCGDFNEENSQHIFHFDPPNWLLRLILYVLTMIVILGFPLFLFIELLTFRFTKAKNTLKNFLEIIKIIVYENKFLLPIENSNKEEFSNTFGFNKIISHETIEELIPELQL